MTAFRSTFAAFVGSLALASASQHVQREVIVNGARLTSTQLASLEYLHCAFIPDGRYWLNTRSGAWGRAGNPSREGYVGEPCRDARRNGYRDGNSNERAVSGRQPATTTGWNHIGFR
jgi:hypothetical protein